MKIHSYLSFLSHIVYGVTFFLDTVHIGVWQFAAECRAAARARKQTERQSVTRSQLTAKAQSSRRGFKHKHTFIIIQHNMVEQNRKDVRIKDTATKKETQAGRFFDSVDTILNCRVLDMLIVFLSLMFLCDHIRLLPFKTTAAP